MGAECRDVGSWDGVRAEARFPQSCFPGARGQGGGPGWATPQDTHVEGGSPRGLLPEPGPAPTDQRPARSQHQQCKEAGLWELLPSRDSVDKGLPTVSVRWTLK